MPSKAKKPATNVNRAPTISHPSKATSPNTQRKSEGATFANEGPNGHPVLSPSDLDLRTGDTTESAGEPNSAPTVNRKKQKRREKEAAKKLAEQQLVNGYPIETHHPIEQIPAMRPGRGPAKGYFTEEPDYANDGFHDSLVEPDDAFYSGDEDGTYSHDYMEDTDNAWLNSSKRKKGPRSHPSYSQPGFNPSRNSSGMIRSALPALSNAAIRSAHKMSNDPIWNTSTQAERENIKQFWLELGEEERRSLVKVEKEAVLKKMKEQQKHSCSCSVCGRKRTAIEEELEVLYDAYYEELEQFANHNNDVPNGPQVMPPPRSYRPLQGRTHPMAGSYPMSGRIRELGDDGEELDEDEEYDDEDDEEPYSDEDYEDDLPTGPSDFFQFGNSLTVKDGILTVADDLLKNDGKHFIDMMEQLAERRMQREEEIHYPAPPLAHQGLRQGHNHPPLDDDDEEYDDEEDDEDYDSQEEDDYEGDEMDSMTEEQRMEEGRRMFQIFAARMFEQRVLTAYREKVAAERQKKLLEELDEESRLDTQREAKKARDAAKKKEKKARQKAAKDEEKAKKDAEKAAQEAAIKEAEAKKIEEQKRRKEEQRRKREAERKAADEEKQRREADKHRRAQEERERQAEIERKQRDAKEQEKKKRDEARKKEREDREAREKDARDRRLKEEQERRVQEEHIKRQREEAQKAEKEAKAKQDQSSKPQPVALPPGLHPVPRSTQAQSPHLQVTTPLLPSTAPTPARARQPSQPSQPSYSSSPNSQQASTDAPQSSTSSASANNPQMSTVGSSAKPHGQPPPLHHPQPSAPRSPLNHVGRGGPYPYHMNGLGMVHPSVGPGIMPGMAPPMPIYQGQPPLGGQQRFGPNGVTYPPGFGGPRPFQSTQPIGFPQPPPSMNMSMGSQGPSHTALPHSRQPSGSEANHQQGPISRPGPIARPSSTTPDKQRPNDHSSTADVEQITAQLGSKALLDDSDEAMPGKLDSRVGFAHPGPPGSGRAPFANQFPEPKHSGFPISSPGWNGFGGMPGAGWSSSTSRPSPAWPQQPFGAISNGPIAGRPHAPRPIAVRLMLVHACRRLSALTGNHSDGYHPVSAVLQQLDQQKMPGEPPVSMDEMLAICDTEGNVQNGGGSFEVIRDAGGHQLVKYIEDGHSGPVRGSVGDIGTPVPQHSPGAAFGSIGQGFGPPGRHF